MTSRQVGEFEAGVLPVDVIVVWRSAGGWHVATVLHRGADGAVDALAPWQEPFHAAPSDSWDAVWRYCAERVRDGVGGNVYSYEVEGFSVASVAGIADLVYARAAEAVVATHGPYGEVAGTFIGAPGAGLVMPFVVLRDEHGIPALVASDHVADPGAVTVAWSDGSVVEPVPFASVEHWQRNGAASWPLSPDATYDVRWVNGSERFHIDAQGGLGHAPPTTDESRISATGAANPDDAPDWDDPIWRIASDTARTARYRRLQGWYRHVHLGIPDAGIGVNGKQVLSTLPQEAVDQYPGLNFITPAAFEHAQARIAAAVEEGATLDPDRLRRNMLSSMPLCFNLFGALATHPALLRLVRAVFDPTAREIVEVLCEWAPRPAAQYLGDRSAFDAIVVYRDDQNRRCFVGIETKYIDRFSPTEYRSARYDDVTAKSGWFVDGAAEQLARSATNQLWRTTMLAASLVLGGGYDRGLVALMSLADDTTASSAAEQVRGCMHDPSLLRHITYSDFVDVASELGDGELAQWAHRFSTRYIPDGEQQTWPAQTAPVRINLHPTTRAFEPELDIAPRVVEALSWGVAAEFVARNPDVVLTEEHPADGTYDCLTIRPVRGVRLAFDTIHLNRHGSGHIWRNHGHYWNWSGMWTELAANHDVAYAALVLEHHAGITQPVAGATSTGGEGSAFIARVLLSQLWSEPTWSCPQLLGHGTFDGIPRPRWIPSHFAPECWLLCRGATPVAAVYTDAGTVVLRSGEEVELAANLTAAIVKHLIKVAAE